MNLSAQAFSLLLQNCMKRKAIEPCKQVHALLLTSNVDKGSFSLGSKLTGVYASCGDLGSAKLVLKEIENPNVFAFNWLISALTFHGYHEEAIRYFSLFQESKRYSPNKYTFSILLKACLGLMDVNKGKEVHCVIYKMSYDVEVSVGNALIDMYGKCGKLYLACKVFDRMANRDVASWTSMICGYSNAGMTEKSTILFEKMSQEGLKPNHFTWNAMIAGSAKRGDCDAAFGLLSRMHAEGLVADLATWNAMISGFVQSQRISEAFKLFSDMLVSDIRPNQVTFTALLHACGMLVSMNIGRELHGLICRMGLYVNAFIASSLIDAYSKCGSVKSALNIFNMISCKNVASWNAMIGCYGKHGMVNLAIKLLERMLDEGVQANEVTLVSILSACGHGGLVEKGMEIFRFMTQCYGIEPNKEHYASVVDLLCRSGRMEEAYRMVQEMPFEVTESMVGAFFNGCKVHERRDLAEEMAKSMELKKPAGFVTLSNIYAAEGDWRHVDTVRKVMRNEGVLKLPGSSRL
ncbi:hypothetical protein M9H77_06179 [Catharanthus roseus]|uniref:Uncharacterized protein n=1 Tax=Catharanthus roseus TaxID=4058 RepID=A0ACC0BRF9_CATRO|nr:hypothetical protein M9H77_06179 [Catharanthus roseus]